MIQNLYIQSLHTPAPVTKTFVMVVTLYCISCRGTEFRKEFSYIGEVRSVVEESVNVMALTATATSATRKVIINSLMMQNPYII